MLKRIEKLTIKNFRGATTPLELDFDNSRPMVMIFGENGSGKSSIVDALDFVCNQKYGSIEDKSSINKKKHLPTIGKNKGDISISIKFDGNEWLAHHQGAIPKTEPAGFPQANILRRSNISKLIDAPPSKRYETLSQFLSVPSIEKCENTLRDAIRNLNTEYDESSRSVTQAKEELEKLQQELNETNKPAEEWAKEITEINEEELVKIIKDAEEMQTLQEKYTIARTALEEAKKMIVKHTEKEQRAVTELDKFHEKETSKEDLQKLLNTAKNYFTNNENINICPVCENNIDGSEVLNSLIQRLSDMADLTKLMNVVKDARKEKEFADELVKTRKKDYEQSASDLVQKIKTSQKKGVAEEENKIDYDKLVSELIDSDSNNVEKSKKELEKYNKYKASLNEQKTIAGKRQHQQKTVKSLFESIKEKETKSKKDAAMLDRLKKYGEIVTTERKQYVDNILTMVTSEIERLYQSIHPEEGLGGIRLYLKPNVRGSLEFDGVFQGSTGIPPQAFYSDAHLDTLGICMFIALAKHFNDNNTIIVLDDVVTSVDEAHRERFLNMLHDEADNFCHMVVTSHYRPWRDFYRIGGGPANKVHFIDLHLWTKESGIRHSKSKLIIDELKVLKENITVDNRQNIASKAGILLEGILDQLALRYGLRVPRQPLQRYDLKTLFNSLSKSKKYIKTIQNSEECKIEIELKTVIEPLENMNEVRNKVGCHWNIEGSLFSDVKIKEFAENTITMVEAVVCHECGNLPNRENTIENYWQCQCGKKQLHPLNIS